MVARRRLDAELVARGLVPDMAAARRAIADRTVLIDGAPGLAEGTLVAASSRISVRKPRPFVSRGGEKLAGALDDMCLDVTGMTCLDAGAGSGGFTDCLLQRGAEYVTAVDVGYGQFDWTLRTDRRVELLERTNLRSVTARGLDPDLIVADLSFVSLRSMAPTLRLLSSGGAWCVLLVKPQFEVPAHEVQPGGLVTEPVAWRQAIEDVVDALAGNDLGVVEAVPSRLKGATGNQEFFVRAIPGEAPRKQVALEAVEMLG